MQRLRGSKLRSALATHRYDVRKELDGTWTVFDVFTGCAYQRGIVSMSGLSAQMAGGIVKLVNSLDRMRRITRGDFND